MAQFFYTEKGYQELNDEIARIDLKMKTEIAQEIAKAADHGDLKENAEYAAAKEKQAHYARKLRALQERYSGANVVRKHELMPEELVTFGKSIKIRDVDSGRERECTILGDGETDLDKGIIAYNSPLAKALIGNKQGETVEAQLPRGLVTFKILSVVFAEGFKD